MKKIRLAIIGTGQRAHAFASAATQNENVEITALCDTNQERLTSFAAVKSLFENKKNGSIEAPKCYTNLDELLNDNICDAVIITVPETAHREVAEKAFAAEMHCMLEKPMAVTEEDCRAIIEAKLKSNCILQVGFVLRATPFYRKVKSIVDSGVLGQIMAIDACEYLGVAHSASYMRRWHRKKQNCGSFILTKCSHDLDLLGWLTDSKATKVASFGGNNFFLPSKQPATHCSKCPEKETCLFEFTKQYSNFVFIEAAAQKDLAKYNFDLCVYNDDKDIVDNQVVIIEYANRIRVKFSLQCFYPGKSTRMIRINGSNGYLEGNFSKNTIRVVNNETLEATTIDLNATAAVGGGHGGGDERFFSEFISSIINKKEPLTDLMAGLNSNILAKAIDDAMLSGEVVKLNG